MINSEWAQRIIQNSKETRQWKVKEILLKMYSEEQLPKFWLQMPKREDKKECDKRFPQDVVTGITSKICEKSGSESMINFSKDLIVLNLNRTNFFFFSFQILSMP